MIARTLDLSLVKQSFFLFGPRQVGKTSLIKETLSPDLYLNLLDHSEFIRFSRNPSLLNAEVAKLGNDTPLIVIDEIQRCPELLNAVQMLIDERPGIKFALTGSSARKLRRAGVNLLGGRAYTFHLHPFTHEELKDLFFLDDALRFGTLPPVVVSNEEQDKIRFLKGYVETYLKEEIQQEALTRNIPAFMRFLELAAFENGRIINFSSLSREIGVKSTVVKEYFSLLEDTLVGFMLRPYSHSARARIVTHPKLYLFDHGVVAALKGSLSQELIEGTRPFGEAFEHWVILETKRILEYRERECRLSFFRTTDGAEVDLILEMPDGVWAVEIKSSATPAAADMKGLKSFISDHPHKRVICVCRTPRPYDRGGVEFLPWADFFRQL
jgi:predicted AAA+ superfamily ATPase